MDGEAREAFAAELCRCRAAAGLSLGRVAADAHVHRAYLHRVEHAERWPSRAVAAALDGALNARGVLLDAWARGETEHREAAEHRRLLAASLRSSAELDALLDPPPGQAADDALAAADGLGLAYLSTPPGPMLQRALAARDRTMTRLAGLHRAGPHRELTRAAGYLSGVLAYAALDLGDDRAATAHAATAYRAGEVVGDGALLAWTRGTQSLIARFGQRYATALELAQAGMTDVGGGTAAPRLLAGQAQSLANLGDADGAHRALTAARGRPGPGGQRRAGRVVHVLPGETGLLRWVGADLAGRSRRRPPGAGRGR